MQARPTHDKPRAHSRGTGDDRWASLQRRTRLRYRLDRTSAARRHCRRHRDHRFGTPRHSRRVDQWGDATAHAKCRELIMPMSLDTFTSHARKQVLDRDAHVPLTTSSGISAARSKSPIAPPAKPRTPKQRRGGAASAAAVA
jgi:hypothetical protein